MPSNLSEGNAVLRALRGLEADAGSRVEDQLLRPLGRAQRTRQRGMEARDEELAVVRTGHGSDALRGEDRDRIESGKPVSARGRIPGRVDDVRRGELATRGLPLDVGDGGAVVVTQ